MNKQREKSASLTVVGVGINLAQTTLEAKAHLEQAEKVYFLASNPIASRWIERLNPTAESLHVLYEPSKSRLHSYNEMVDRIVGDVRMGLNVCAAFYGHPGIFVDPSHRAIRLARSEGFVARMLPGVSAEDYLFADLGVDPSRVGCQSYEATDFILHRRRFDPSSSLVLWQIGVIGDIAYNIESDIRIGINILADQLIAVYGGDHTVVVYEGAMLPLYPSRVHHVPLASLPTVSLSAVSTLYIPPLYHAVPDMGVVAALGLGQYFG